MRHIFSWVGDVGCSRAEVARRLFERSINTAHGKSKLDRETIRGILINPGYHGHAVYGKQRLVGRKPGKRAKRSDPAVPRQAKVTAATNISEQTVIPVPAIIDQALFEIVRVRMDENLKRQKSRTCSTDGVEFLGFIFNGYGGQIRVSPKKIKKFKDRVREITRRNRGVSMRARVVELRRYLQGWVGYFRLVPLKSFYEDLDKWIRRRLRACLWRQWRSPRTRIRNLLKLGVPKVEAIAHGCSSKGTWVMSSSKAVHMALSLDFLKRLGVVSLLEIWTKLASKR